MVGSEALAWREHDVFVVPSWREYHHEAADESLLFSFLGSSGAGEAWAMARAACRRADAAAVLLKLVSLLDKSRR